ncbi:MAG: ATP-dependent 6-phosphofructokinase [Planctomycetota bacterium]|jgi:6-phosphofructokinase 1
MEKLNFTTERLGECTVESPLTHTHFVGEDEKVIYHKCPDAILAYREKHGELAAFEKAGPRETIYHDPAWTKAAIITAGGLCPGLNDVIKGLTQTLGYHYGVSAIYGIRYGFEGLNPEFGHEPLLLKPEDVDDIHDAGGTILGSSRGRQPRDVMVDTLVRMNINVLFCIGGDGTQRCAHDIHVEIKKRGLNISVVGIPKTIDNDISNIDRTFGFETAVYATNPVITCAHNEATGAYNGVGLIHVMGRDSGFIAAYSALANSDVNYCLVPEERFSLEEGENAFLPHLFRRLERQHHAVVIVAEGAGQELMESEEVKRDASGNKLHQNIGRFLRAKINEYSEKVGTEVNVKYFDPSYSIRSLAAHGTDAVFCMMLAHNAVHAAMAGHSDLVVGHWHDSFTLVPIPIATSERKKIDPIGALWRSVRTITWPE